MAFSRMSLSAVLNMPLDDGIKDKISLFCNVPMFTMLSQNLDVDVLYEAPLAHRERETGTGCLQTSRY